MGKVSSAKRSTATSTAGRQNVQRSPVQPSKSGKPAKRSQPRKKKGTNPFAKLSEKDPELFDFLKKNDDQLLDFNMETMDPEVINDSGDENEGPQSTSVSDKKQPKAKKPLSKKKKKKAEEINEAFNFTDEPEPKKKKRATKSTAEVEESEDQKVGKDELDLNKEDDQEEQSEGEEDDEDDYDEDDEDDDDDDDDEEQAQESDQEDFEEEDEDDDDEENSKRWLRDVQISEQMIIQWAEKLQNKPDKDTLKQVVLKFRSAVKCISGKSPKVRAEAAVHFNSIFKMVLLDLHPALMSVLKLEPNADEKDQSSSKLVRPKKSVYWKKYATLIKVYLISLLEVLDTLANDEILATLLKHLLNMVPFFLCHLPLVKRLLRQVSTIWSEGTGEQSRVLSFLIILRMLRDQKSEMIGYILKKLYMSYVRNCKFTDQHNLAMINFMRQSLVELYSLDQGVAYQHGFVFIRQCAITLRNSMMSNKKEGFKAVYNWQYIHSLLLWSRTLACLNPSDVMQPLVFPLVQVIFGTIKLIPSSRYIPLRIHLIKALIKLSSSTNTFVPILPYIVEILDIINRGQKYKLTRQKKKTNVDCLLKLPNDFIDTTEFVELCIHQVYELVLEYCASQSHSIAFPELILVAVCRLKKFLKSWKNPIECKKLKQLLDKLNESSRFIEERRRQVTFNIAERERVDAWEKDIQLTGTPLSKFFEQWKKVSVDQSK